MLQHWPQVATMATRCDFIRQVSCSTHRKKESTQASMISKTILKIQLLKQQFTTGDGCCGLDYPVEGEIASSTLRDFRQIAQEAVNKRDASML